MSNCAYHLMQNKTEQLSISERKVYDGRKPKFTTTFDPLKEQIAEAPCLTCPKLFTLCDTVNCDKITLWLTT